MHLTDNRVFADTKGFYLVMHSFKNQKQKSTISDKNQNSKYEPKNTKANVCKTRGCGR